MKWIPSFHFYSSLFQRVSLNYIEDSQYSFCMLSWCVSRFFNICVNLIFENYLLNAPNIFLFITISCWINCRWHSDLLTVIIGRRNVSGILIRGNYVMGKYIYNCSKYVTMKTIREVNFVSLQHLAFYFKFVGCWVSSDCNYVSHLQSVSLVLILYSTFDSTA